MTSRRRSLKESRQQIQARWRQRAAPSRRVSSCRMPRLPIRVPRAACAMISPVGVTRFCSGIGGRYALTQPSRTRSAGRGSRRRVQGLIRFRVLARGGGCLVGRFRLGRTFGGLLLIRLGLGAGGLLGGPRAFALEALETVVGLTGHDSPWVPDPEGRAQRRQPTSRRRRGGTVRWSPTRAGDAIVPERLRPAAWPAATAGRSVENHQILGRTLAVASRHQLVLDLLALAQGAQAGALHRRDVDERVLGAVARL